MTDHSPGTRNNSPAGAPARVADEDLAPQVRLRWEHARMILRAIRAQGAVSRTELAEEHGLSGQSVGRIVRELIEDGLVEETGAELGRGPGAPRIGLRARQGGAVALGFGLERDQLTGVLLDFGGEVRWETSAAIPRGEPASVTLDRVESAMDDLLHTPEWASRRSLLCGVGVAAPGPVDLASGRIVGAPNFPNWENVSVVDYLEPRLSLPVLLDNAATAAAIGTKWQTHRSRPFLYCYWGLGIGGGLISDDDAYRGATGNAIELGHIAVTGRGHPCDCGGVGCLEVEASASAILRDASRYGDFDTVAAVVQAAATSRPLKQLLRDAASKMSAGLLSAVNLLDVDELVIGGEHFQEVQDIFLPVIRDRLKTRAFRRQIAPTSVALSGSGEAANAVGAAALVFHSLLPRLKIRNSRAGEATHLAAVRVARRARQTSAVRVQSGGALAGGKSPPIHG